MTIIQLSSNFSPPQVFKKIDPDAFHDGLQPVEGNSQRRVCNLDKVWKNVRNFYEEQLSCILLRTVDIVKLGQEPDSHTEEMMLLLTLFVGAAVQSLHNNDFVTIMQSMDPDDQVSLMTSIKQITEGVDIVLSLNDLKNLDCDSVFQIIKRIDEERNNAMDLTTTLPEFDQSTYCTITRDIKSPMSDMTESDYSRRDSSLYTTSGSRRESMEACQQSQLRKLRQEQDALRVTLAENIEELEEEKFHADKLKEENQILQQELKAAKTVRDDLDALMEKALMVDKLERDIKTYQNQLKTAETFKYRCSELAKENQVLMQLCGSLRDELSGLRIKCGRIPELEDELNAHKQLLEQKNEECIAEQKKNGELLEENCKLQNSSKLEEEANGANDTINSDTISVTESNLRDQLMNDGQAKLLDLELENQKLRLALEELNETDGEKLRQRNKKLTVRARERKVQNKELHWICAQATGQIDDLGKLVKEKHRKLVSLKQKHDVLRSKHESIMDLYMDMVAKNREATNNGENASKTQKPEENLISSVISLSDGDKKTGGLTEVVKNWLKSDSIRREILTYNVVTLSIAFLCWKNFGLKN